MDSIRGCVQKAIDEAGNIDVLINCAGINKREGFLDVEENTYDRIMDINLKGLYFLSQEVAKNMMRQKSGNIINMASHNSVDMEAFYGLVDCGSTAIVEMAVCTGLPLVESKPRAEKTTTFGVEQLIAMLQKEDVKSLFSDSAAVPRTISAREPPPRWASVLWIRRTGMTSSPWGKISRMCVASTKADCYRV